MGLKWSKRCSNHWSWEDLVPKIRLGGSRWRSLCKRPLRRKCECSSSKAVDDATTNTSKKANLRSPILVNILMNNIRMKNASFYLIMQLMDVINAYLSYYSCNVWPYLTTKQQQLSYDCIMKTYILNWGNRF